MNTNITKQLPVGVDNFKKLIEGFYFVDKTHFIANLLDSYSEVSLITRPRRFGKSLILSMLEYFFTIDNAKDNRALFNDLKISKFDKNYMVRQGKSPVILISLKDIDADDFDTFVNRFAIEISDIAMNLLYLLDHPIIKKYYITNFKRLCDQEATIEQLGVSLKFLTKLLYIYHHKKVILLIDEYDSPIVNAWNKKYYDKCISFMKNFLGSCLKSNKYLDFAVLTGITRMAKESIFSGVDNFSVFSVFDDAFSDVFGFTEEEVVKFLDYYNISDKVVEVKEWYGGYQFGNKGIYNPCSIVNYIRNKYYYNAEPTGYWVNTSRNVIINYILQSDGSFIKEGIEELMKHNSISKLINENLGYGQITTSVNALFLMLISSGYLKIVNKMRRGNRWSCTLTIPNKEVYEAFEVEISEMLPTEC